MNASELRVIGVTGLPEIEHGDHLAELIVASIGRSSERLIDGDVLVVTQKVVSKAEGRVVPIDAADPSAKRRLAESEAIRILRRRGDLVITETAHGFICANSGVDLSNVREGFAVLLPLDPDRSARGLRDAIAHLLKVRIAVVISDTFGRPWRRGVTDIAIGTAGVAAVVDLRQTQDALGRELVATEVCVADEITSAANLVMGKADGVPIAIVRGINPEWLRESSVRNEIIRNPNEDLFR